MRRELYSTSEPKFFANMCNIDGTEDITGETFEDWLYRTHEIQESELSDSDYDSYFDEYRSCSAADSAGYAEYGEAAPVLHPERALDELAADIARRDTDTEGCQAGGAGTTGGPEERVRALLPL